MINLPKSLHLLISFVFILSALAKLFDLSATVQMFATLFALSPGFVASLFTWGVILFELVIACLVWWRVPWPLVLVPLVFIAIVVYADSQGLACGCFGSLSFFTAFPARACGTQCGTLSRLVVSASEPVRPQGGRAAGFSVCFWAYPRSTGYPVDTENLSEQISQHSLQDRSLIVYCSSADCLAAEQLAARLVAAGCRFVRLYPGGWDD